MATIPPWYVSQGIGAVALSPPQAAAASTTQHDQTFMAPPAHPSLSAHAWLKVSRSAPKRQNRRVRRRFCVTLLRDIFARRPRSTSLLFSQHAVSPSVTEIDGKPDREPDEEPHPRVQRKREHEAETGEDAEHWHERYERCAERSLEIGSRMSQDPYAGAHQHEREQRADVDPRPEQLQRQQPGCEAYRDAGVDRGEVRRAEPRVDSAGPGPEQAVARHRVEDAGLPEQHDENHGADAQDRAEIDREANPPGSADPLHRVRHRRREIELAVDRKRSCRERGEIAVVGGSVT